MEGCKCKPAKSFAQRIIEYQEFVSLVKRMREAQADQEIISARLMYIREHKGVLTDKDFSDVASITNKVVDLEDEVDKYLKKMESIDQRKALEAENTEFDYGHNVKHYSED